MFFKSKISKATDEELIAEFLSTGHHKYYGEICDRYIPLVYGLCLKYLRNAACAQDAVMQIMEDIQEHLPQQVKSFRAWIYVVSKNYCLQQLRHPAIEVVTDFDTTFIDALDKLHGTDDEEGQRLDVLKRCIENLPMPQRICIQLFFIEEKSYSDIVEKTGFSLNAVKSHIQNGKRNLKISIEKNVDLLNSDH